MNNDIVQLTDKNGNNVFPIAGAATQDSISRSMLEEGVFEGPELFPAPTGAYVRTNDIVDGAVTSDKIDWTTFQPSATEKVVGTWIDGTTPVYEQAFTGTVALSANTLARVTVLPNITRVVGCGGWWQSYTDQWSSFGGSFSTTIFSGAGVRLIDNVLSGELRFQSSTSYTASYEVWVRYLK